MVFSEYMQSLSHRDYIQVSKLIRSECRVQPSAFWRWVYGGVRPTPVYCKLISDILNKPEGELFPEMVQ